MRPTKPAKFPKVSELELSDLKLTFKVGVPLSSEEPDLFFDRISGRIHIMDDEFYEKKCICKLDALVFRSDRLDEAGYDVLSSFDSIDDNVIRYYEALYDGDDIKDSVLSEIEPGFGSNLLIIDKVHVRSEYRGRNIGLLCALNTIEIFGGVCQYVALRPFPLQFGAGNRELSEEQRRRKHLHGFDPHEAKALSKIRKHWSRLGFRKIGDGDVYLLSMAYKLPTSEDLFRTAAP